jgi:hypothetical protein
MYHRIRSTTRLGLLTLLTLAPALAAQTAAPLTATALGAPEAGEVTLRLTLEQLDSVGVPEVAARPGRTTDLGVVALRLDRFGAEVDGRVRTALGQVGFRSAAGRDGRVLVEHDLGDRGDRGTLALAVDRAAQTADPVYPAGLRLTQADRFTLRVLALVLEQQLAQRDANLDENPEADLLLRATRLWGDHPLQEVGLARIQAPQTKSWTNLCGVTSANLAHDGSGHGLITERLATGPNASNCRARCGAGCTAILGTSAWTVDCGEHDRCEQHHSCCISCQDEFNSASDDYLFASNCRLSGW